MEIEIKKGDYGVSWAIKRQLKEEGVNTGKINSCWTEIMQAFQGDKESKVNEKAIGDQWTTLNANVEVNVGQKLTIAETTWNKIKQIVQKAVGGNPPTGGDNKAEGASAAAASPAAEAKAPAAEASSAKPVTKEQCSATKCNNIVYHKATKTYYSVANGEFKPIKPYYTDGRIISVHEDGTTIQRTPGEEEGSYWLTKVSPEGKRIAQTERNKDKQVLCSVEYDKNNYVKKLTDYSNGKPSYTYDYKDDILTCVENHNTGINVNYRFHKALNDTQCVLKVYDSQVGTRYYLYDKNNVNVSYECNAKGERI